MAGPATITRSDGCRPDGHAVQVLKPVLSPVMSPPELNNSRSARARPAAAGLTLRAAGLGALLGDLHDAALCLIDQLVGGTPSGLKPLS